MNQPRSLEGCKVLILDDHKNIRVSLRYTLAAEGALISEAENFAGAKSLLPETADKPDEFPFHVLLLDIRLPDGNGLDILSKVADLNLASRVIMISGEGTVTEAFKATQMGAFDYIEKPFHPERILVSVKRCLDYNQIQSAHAALEKQVRKGQELLGSHPSLRDVIKVIDRVAPTSGRVLIVGETGTGKELVAKAIHQGSDRSEKPLVKVNCAAIPHSLIESELFGHEKGAFTGAVKSRKGLFEQAHSGTLLLDEIGELDPSVQAKLLRVLETGEIIRLGSEKSIKVDVRVLASTHRDLQDMVENKEFREDLFFRLNVVTVNIPPLRERGDDVKIIAQRFLEIACEEHALGERSFNAAALAQLCDYHWPGNIRELKNIVERVAILSDEQVIGGNPRHQEI